MGKSYDENDEQLVTPEVSQSSRSNSPPSYHAVVNQNDSFYSPQHQYGFNDEIFATPPRGRTSSNDSTRVAIDDSPLNNMPLTPENLDISATEAQFSEQSSKAEVPDLSEIPEVPPRKPQLPTLSQAPTSPETPISQNPFFNATTVAEQPLALEYNRSPPNKNFKHNDTHQNTYRGLVNQAMTCYLNSLLQSLFMTPEFRNALYNFKEESTEEDQLAKSIPYQLQRLFVQMQFLTDKKSIQTVDMTKSFGWTGSDAFQQHDVQELLRVMFDALEKKLKGTPQEKVLDELYQGQMIDYVKCLYCKYESRREDTFQDIALAIKPFGATKTFGSVDEALADFVKPETLDGNNQYHCQKCQAKRDAEKGLKIKKLPNLLTIQLKRFDFDYETLQRVKLSDRVEFKTVMDLEKYVAQVS